MIRTISPADLQPLVEMINKVHQGDLLNVSHDLAMTAYLLHHVSESDAGHQGVQHVSFGLQQLYDGFYQSHLKLKAGQ